MRNVLFGTILVATGLASQTSGEQLSSTIDSLCVGLERNGGNVEALTQKIATSIHYYGLCDDSGPCYAPATRRVEDYSVFIVAPTGFDIGKSLVARTSKLLTELSDLTESRAHFRTPETLNMLAFVVVDEEDSTGELNATIENIVAPENLGFPEIRRTVFSNWLKSDRLCTEITTEYEDGTIQDAQIWVKLGYSDEDTFACVEAVTLKTMGLKKLEPVSFNDPSLRNSWFDANSLSFSALYSDLVKPGQSYVQTKLKLARAIRTTCK